MTWDTTTSQLYVLIMARDLMNTAQHLCLLMQTRLDEKEAAEKRAVKSESETKELEKRLVEIKMGEIERMNDVSTSLATLYDLSLSFSVLAVNAGYWKGLKPRHLQSCPFHSSCCDLLAGLPARPGMCTCGAAHRSNQC